MPYTKSNDSYDKVYYRATTRSGEVIDLTGASVQFKMESRKGELLVNSPATILNASNGEMEYQLTEADTILSGVHRAEFTVTFSDGKEKTVPEDGYIQVTITSDIDTDRDTANQEAVAIYVSEIEAFKTDINATVDDYGVRLDAVEAEQVDQDLRIDNIVAQSGTDNTEQVDARLGADGVARNVMGELIREIHQEQLLANKDKKTLVHGLNIITSDTASALKVEFYGQTRVNLLGKIGNFETDSNGDGIADGWTYNSTIGQKSLVTSNKYGTKAQRITSLDTDHSADRYVGHKLTNLKVNSHYLAVVDVENDGSTVARMAVGGSSDERGNNGILSVKFVATSSEHTMYLYNRGAIYTSGLWVQFDGVRVFEISSETYNEIGVSLTDADVERLFPYVDGIKGVKNPVLSVSGINLFGKDIMVNRHKYLFTNGGLGSAGDGTGTTDYVEVVEQQSYTTSFTNGYSFYRVAFYDKDKVNVGYSDSSTFTTPNNTKYIRVSLKNVGDLEFYDTQPMLNLGSTALPFVEKNDSYLYAETTLYGNDVKKDILMRNESLDVPRWEKTKWFELSEEITTVKSTASLTNVDLIHIYSVGFDISFKNNLTTNNGEVLVEIPMAERDNTSNIGKYYTASGDVWLIVAKGTTTLNENYFLLYQLAESVVVPLDNGEVEGDLSIQGDAQVSVTSGFSYTTDTEGNRTYTLTPESERYAETCNISEVIANYDRTMKSSFNGVVAKQSDIATEVSIHDRQILDIMLRLDAGGL